MGRGSFQDRGGKFVQELQPTFESAFWELYLHAAIEELRLLEEAIELDLVALQNDRAQLKT